MTSQFSSISSAAYTQVCPKLSQYLSQRPPYGSVFTSAMQDPHVTPSSTSGHSEKAAQAPVSAHQMYGDFHGKPPSPPQFS
eukprot:CAMPEP_0115525998 /NCGR_PEP_ID=MMETSP0271-20121206/82057_1 /TAXON_ID=71861 /ORGANISM="Scrippsiella trochoidea, Strain CCMP3099" /LENGTH=80 /DNA_ID=CAMNT_0002957691 /DNA_START=138 /DNA_END=380 /DNA_ORIENTATION=-